MGKKNKKNLSVRTLIMFPVIILGVVSIISNILAMSNIRNMNSKAGDITDVYMRSLIDISVIQDKTESIHQKSLSHIIASDFNSMTVIAESIKEQMTELENKLDDYGQLVDGVDKDKYMGMKENYDSFKKSVITLVTLSASSKTTEAYACANGELASAANAMLDDANSIMEEASLNSETAKNHLHSVYITASARNIICIILSVLSIAFAMLVVMEQIIKPVMRTEKDILSILEEIDNREGDLTRRVKVAVALEIGNLGKGINSFMEKLQHIFGILNKDSLEMENVVVEVMDSVNASNDSVTDLSALSEELAASMEEVSSNTNIINDNAMNVRKEVTTIAEKSAEISEFSKQMKDHAQSMENAAKQNMANTNEKISEIMNMLNQSILESKSVDQVNTLTNDILDISSQTTLLALNASIEAARAGEAGKGFAVVASEISKLAESSQMAANRIQEINTIVVKAVNNLSDNSQELISFMNESILPEFEKFVITGNKYRENAVYIEDTMNQFSNQTEHLERGAVDISDSIKTITLAIEESVKGINGVAESVQQLVEDMDNITKRMEDNKKISSELQNETSIFTNF